MRGDINLREWALSRDAAACEYTNDPPHDSRPTSIMMFHVREIQYCTALGASSLKTQSSECFRCETNSEL
eukprot:7382539-Prymnesium_polylepis.2